MFCISTAADGQTVAASFGYRDCLTADAVTVKRYLQTLSAWQEQQTDSLCCAPESVSVITATDCLSQQLDRLFHCLGFRGNGDV